MSNSHIKLGDALPEKLLVSHVRLMGFDLSVPKIVSICGLTSEDRRILTAMYAAGAQSFLLLNICVTLR